MQEGISAWGATLVSGLLRPDVYFKWFLYGFITGASAHLQTRKNVARGDSCLSISHLYPVFFLALT